MKHWLLVLALTFSAPVWAEVSCDDLYDWIQVNKRNIDTLEQEVRLVMLDIQSYNPDQHNTPEYIDRKTTYDTLLENFNAIVTNHNQTIDFYKRQCEQ